MTWSVNAGGHHQNRAYDEWRVDEYLLLDAFVAVLEAAGNQTVTSTFKFNGNHVSVNSLDEAKQKLAEYEAEGK